MLALGWEERGLSSGEEQVRVAEWSKELGGCSKILTALGDTGAGLRGGKGGVVGWRGARWLLLDPCCSGRYGGWAQGRKGRSSWVEGC
jgi:hypothetical protein